MRENGALSQWNGCETRSVKSKMEQRNSTCSFEYRSRNMLLDKTISSTKDSRAARATRRPTNESQ